MYHRLPEHEAQQAREHQLEAQANALLRQNAQPEVPCEYPFYLTDSSLRQAAARDAAFGERQLGPSPDCEAWGPVLQGLCERVELSATNRELLRLMREGWRGAQIAQALGLTLKAVRRRQDRIIRRLRRLAERSNLRLLHEAYDDQLEGHRYHPEQHCNPGREACRRDGKCRYRWYLYAIVAEQEMA